MVRHGLLLPLALAGTVALAAPALADDAGFLTRLLQDQLSDSGREVRITGFRGALSSRATIDELTIADDEGVWLTLRGAVLDWNRAALFRRALSVNELAAEEIIVARRPLGDDRRAPSPEAGPFALPELPLSIRIGEITAERVILGAPVLGAAAELALEGTATLEGGAGSARLEATRIDGAEGVLRLAGSFDNQTRMLELDLVLREGPGGLAAAALDLPDRPAVRLAIEGAGPLTDFRADVALETDGAPRLTGAVELRSEPGAAGARGPLAFRADLAGDITPLFTPEFRGFFGTDTRLAVAGTRGADGGFELTELDLASEEVTLSGTLTLRPGGLPERVAIEGQVAARTGGSVLLPIGGERTRIDRAALRVAFDAADGEDWTLAFDVAGLSRPDLTIARLALDGTGRITTGNGAPAAIRGAFGIAAEGLAPEDPGLAEALGAAITGALTLDWQQGAPVAFPAVTVTGSDYRLEGTARIEGERVIGSVEAAFSDLARLSTLAGRPLGGAVTASVAGEAGLVSGQFDAAVDVSGRGLRIGQDAVDTLLAGSSRIAGRLARGEAGTVVEDLTVAAATLQARIDGIIRSTASDLEATLDFADLSVLGPEFGGRLAAEGRLISQETDAAAEPEGGPPPLRQIVRFTATGTDLNPGIDELGRLLAGESRIELEALIDGDETVIDRFILSATTLAANLSGRIGPRDTEMRGTLDFSDLGVLGPGYGGRLAAEGRMVDANGSRRILATATGRDLRVGADRADRVLTGQSRIGLDATLTGDRLRLERLDVLTASGLSAQASGTRAPEATAIDLRLALRSLSALDPAWSGAITAAARLEETGGTRRIAAEATGTDLGLGIAPADRLLAGETGLSLVARQAGDVLMLEALDFATATGLSVSAAGEQAPGGTEILADLVLESLAALDPRFGGRLTANARYGEQAGERSLVLDAQGANLATGIFELDQVLRGASRLTLEAAQIGERLRVRDARLTTPLLTAEADATVEGETRRLDLNARLADLGALVPDLPGPVTVAGTLTDSTPTSYAVDLRATGPGGIAAQVGGSIARDLTAALAISGNANLGLVNRVLATINVQGDARFDLRLDGPPAPASLSGTVSTTNARVVLPGQAMVLENIAATARLGGGAVDVDTTARVQGGGQIAASGRIGLAAGFPAELSATITNARISDRRIFDTRVSGDLRIFGRLVRGGTVAGSLALGETELRIPSSGLGFAGYVPPDLVHFGETPEARETRLRARLNGDRELAESRNPFALDLTLSAPNRVFIRGRGIDAELGGTLRLTGNTDNVVPSGEFGLIRGRLDILGRRFILSDGFARLQGRFVPFVQLLATTSADGIAATITVQGEADALDIRFSSVPELPEEEVVALILFGRGLDRLSPFQAAQLASAIATLAGRGGEGLVGQLRTGFGLDDLDVSTTEDGLAALRLGRYLTENVYTDVTIDAEGRTELSINLDLSTSFTLRLRTDTDGGSGVGVFFERDY